MLDILVAEEKDVKEHEKEVTEEKGGATEELDWEELRAQVFHILLELEETKEVSLRHQEEYLELQGEWGGGGYGPLAPIDPVLLLVSGQLEEERLLSAEQAEAFSRQIQGLKGTGSLSSPPKKKKGTDSHHPPPPAPTDQLSGVQEQRRRELLAAREEVLLVQQAAEEAAAERENDIASLQEELCRRRAELQRLSEETQEYELEITTLRAEISMKSQRREAERREGERARPAWGSSLKNPQKTAAEPKHSNGFSDS